MANYEEILEQSQINIRALNEKLKNLEKLNLHIQELIKQPEIFQQYYQQIVSLSEQYINTLGGTTQTYLEGNNTMFTTKLSELDTDINKFEHEVTRLQTIDLEKHFDKHQKTLSEIFNAVNGINLNLANSIQTLTNISQAIATLQNTIDKNENKTESSFSNITNDLKLLRTDQMAIMDDVSIFKKRVVTSNYLQIASIVLILLILFSIFILKK